MSRYECKRIFEELVRCADIEAAIQKLSDAEVRSLSVHLDDPVEFSKSGVPGMIQGLLQIDAARRFMERGEE